MLAIKNLTGLKVDKKFLQKVAEKVLDNLPRFKKKIKKTEIELVIIGEKRMRSLNRIWRGKDKATDVLSFESGQLKKEIRDFIIPEGEFMNLGQIFVCYPVLSRQAKKYNYSAKEEMSRLLIHGILHLAGFDHEKSALEEKKMMNLQEKIFSLI